MHPNWLSPFASPKMGWSAAASVCSGGSAILGIRRAQYRGSAHAGTNTKRCSFLSLRSSSSKSVPRIMAPVAPSMAHGNVPVHVHLVDQRRRLAKAQHDAGKGFVHLKKINILIHPAFAQDFFCDGNGACQHDRRIRQFSRLTECAPAV